MVQQDAAGRALQVHRECTRQARGRRCLPASFQGPWRVLAAFVDPCHQAQSRVSKPFAKRNKVPLGPYLPRPLRYDIFRLICFTCCQWYTDHAPYFQGESAAAAAESAPWQVRMYNLFEDPASSRSAMVLSLFIIGVIVLSCITFIMGTWRCARNVSLACYVLLLTCAPLQQNLCQSITLQR